MAERRMFAKTIIDSDAFLDMPATSQLLYFHLAMRADDDGFVNNPKKILRMIGGTDDDLKLLILKKFVIFFESGVAVIKHWKIHNYIRNDRYKETKYKRERDALSLDENSSYTLGIPNDNQRYTTGIPNDNQMDTQVRLEIGKDIDIDRDSINNNLFNNNDTPNEPTVAKKQYGEFKHVLLYDKEMEKLKSEYGLAMTARCIRHLDEYIEEKEYKSNSHYLAIKRWVIKAVNEQPDVTKEWDWDLIKKVLNITEDGNST